MYCGLLSAEHDAQHSCLRDEWDDCGSCSTAGMNVKQSATRGVLGESKARATTYKREEEASEYCTHV